MKRLILLLPILLFSIIINSQNWGEQILNQPNPGANHAFGHSVDIDGDYAVVGAPSENFSTGSVHIYKIDVNGNWNHHQRIEAFVGKHAYESFGTTVAIEGDYIFVGVPDDRLNEDMFENRSGSVMIYKKDVNDQWNGIQRFYSSDAGIRFGGDFGSSISVDGDFLVVGDKSEGDDANGQNFVSGAGAAYIYQKNVNDVWNFVQKITPSHRERI